MTIPNPVSSVLWHLLILAALCNGAAPAGPAGQGAMVMERAPASSHTPVAAPRPLFREFMGLNGHFTFKPGLYRQVGRLVRNYHNLNWDVERPGGTITLPVCVNRVNWKNDVYGRWQAAGYETDICLQFSGFQADTAGYRGVWAGQDQWCYQYGRAVAAYFGPSGSERLCTSVEIGNEPGVKFDPALFKSIFQQMARGIRAGDARVKILTPAVQARAGDDYLQDVRELYGDSEILPLYDVINLHTYAAVERQNPSESPWVRSYPEDPSIAYLKVVDEAIAWRNTHAPGKEVWVTEFGYDACTPGAMQHRKDWSLKLDWQGNTDLQQAQYLVRSLFAFAARDVRRAYIYFYNDDDSPSVHGASGLTRHFVPKPSYWACKQLYELLGDYRFVRAVKQLPGDLFVYEFRPDAGSSRAIWAVWSPTGARTNAKEPHQPREMRVTLADLPSVPTRVVAMETSDVPAPEPRWEKAAPRAITLTVGESPIYIVMQQ